MTDEKMVVLGNGDTPKKLFIESNELESYEHGIALLKKTRNTVKNVSREFLMTSSSVGGTPDEDDDRYDSMTAACYHQETDDDGQDCITYFPGHVDKRYIHNVWFVPLVVNHPSPFWLSHHTGTFDKIVTQNATTSCGSVR